MDLLENRISHPNVIKSAQADFCVIGDETYQRSVIIPFDGKIIDADFTSVNALDQAMIQNLCDYQPEVIILATGSQIIFPETEFLTPLINYNIGLEVLHNEAAARTFNVLLAEDRKVVCLMLISQSG